MKLTTEQAQRIGALALDALAYVTIEPCPGFATFAVVNVSYTDVDDSSKQRSYHVYSAGTYRPVGSLVFSDRIPEGQAAPPGYCEICGRGDGLHDNEDCFK